MSRAGKYLRLLEDEVAQLEADSRYIEIDDYVWCKTFQCTHKYPSKCVGEEHVKIFVRE